MFLYGAATMKRIAVYNGSREIYIDMVSAVKSLLFHTQVDKVYLMIEDDSFSYELPDIVQLVNVSKIADEIFNPDGPNYHTKWTVYGLMRQAMTKVFPEYDIVLGIDADTIVQEDISDIWDIDLSGYYYAAAKEPLMSARSVADYYNAGILLCNLKKLREDGMDDRIIREINSVYYPYNGQDVMCKLCEGKILELPSDYNASQFTLPTEHKKILHFANNRTWLNSGLAEYYRGLSCKTLQRDSMTADDGESAENLSSVIGKQ